MSELQQKKPIIVCLCGSTRFVEEFHYVDRLCKAHRIRYSRNFFPERTAEQAARLLP